MAVEQRMLDTGVLVALLAHDDARHAACVSATADYQGVLVTSEAGLTEAMHLLGRFPGGADACLEFTLTARVALVPMTPFRLTRCRRLMQAYRDVPMDFADATLVAIAEEMRVEGIFTLDRRGFQTYRLLGRRAFQISP